MGVATRSRSTKKLADTTARADRRSPIIDLGEARVRRRDLQFPFCNLSDALLQEILIVGAAPSV